MRRPLLLAALLFACVSASADVLVRNCDTPSSTGCAVTPQWVATSSAINVQVDRSGSPYVALSSVQPSERIAACYDTAIQPGSTAKCGATVPNRSDLWELKSTLYPTTQEAVGQITVTWDPITVDTEGVPLGVDGYTVSRQQDVCLDTSADPRCGTMPWLSEDLGNVTQKIYTGLSGRWCFRVQGRLASGELGAISVPDADDCATAGQKLRLPGAVQNLRATGP